MIIKFPTKEYTILRRRDDYINEFFSSVCEAASGLGIDIEKYEEFGAIFSLMRDVVNNHLEIDDGCGTCFEEA